MRCREEIKYGHMYKCGGESVPCGICCGFQYSLLFLCLQQGPLGKQGIPGLPGIDGPPVRNQKFTYIQAHAFIRSTPSKHSFSTHQLSTMCRSTYCSVQLPVQTCNKHKAHNAAQTNAYYKCMTVRTHTHNPEAKLM